MKHKKWCLAVATTYTIKLSPTCVGLNEIVLFLSFFFFLNYIPMTHLFYNWRFIPFTYLTHFAHPLLLATTNLFSVSVSLFFLCFVCLDIPHISEIIQCLSSSVWLISLSIMPSMSSILSQVIKIHSFVWLNSSPLYRYTTTSLSVHPSVDI